MITVDVTHRYRPAWCQWIGAHMNRASLWLCGVTYIQQTEDASIPSLSELDAMIAERKAELAELNAYRSPYTSNPVITIADGSKGATCEIRYYDNVTTIPLNGSPPAVLSSKANESDVIRYPENVTPVSLLDALAGKEPKTPEPNRIAYYDPATGLLDEPAELRPGETVFFHPRKDTP